MSQAKLWRLLHSLIVIVFYPSLKSLWQYEHPYLAGKLSQTPCEPSYSPFLAGDFPRPNCSILLITNLSSLIAKPGEEWGFSNWTAGQKVSSTSFDKVHSQCVRLQASSFHVTYWVLEQHFQWVQRKVTFSGPLEWDGLRSLANELWHASSLVCSPSTPVNASISSPGLCRFGGWRTN